MGTENICWNHPEGLSFSATMICFQKKKKYPKSKCCFQEVISENIKKVGGRNDSPEEKRQLKAPGTRADCHRQGSKSGDGCQSRETAPLGNSTGRQEGKRTRVLPTSSFFQGRVFKCSFSVYNSTGHFLKNPVKNVFLHIETNR